MAFLEGIAGYVERKGSKKRRHKTESGQRYSLNGLMTDLGSTASPIVSLPGETGEAFFCRCRYMFSRSCGDVFPIVSTTFTAHNCGSYNP